ncbi:thermonuclease family protein [Microbacterium jejuense]|uniref:thermonuclease family protein n=1 Tax=Microbacterium jejuense TaxID=1263637 RepID=UPI0031E80A5E
MGTLVLGGGAIATVSAVSEANNSDEAVVTRVIDGDTIDVRMYGDVHRVRLLNIDSPEDNAATGVAECMGPEATAALAKLLPEGSAVTLRYDSERYDRYDRLLAGIFVDGVLINAEIAREGLAVPLVVGSNTRFIGDVESAVTEAMTNQAGIFGTSLPCTLGSAVASYRTQADAAVASTVPSDSASIANVIGATTVALAAADVANATIDAIEWVTPDLRKPYKTQINDLRGEVAKAKTDQEASYASAVAAEKAEADRLAAEEAARAAAEKAAADQAAREAAERQSRNSGSSGGGGGSSGDGGGSTYTGCRNYNGYGMIDTKGRHFEPIPCP